VRKAFKVHNSILKNANILISVVVAFVVGEGKKSWLTKNISRRFSTSTASFLCIRIIFFGVLQSDAVFGNGGMDADARVK
jgi:hypothetical protein